MRRFLSCVLALLIVPTAAVYAQKAPEFSSDAVWLDSGAKVPHSIKAYRGRVVLIDFWEYTCINCIRDFAVLKRWYAKYHPSGFEIIGVHFGEFAIGYKPENVRRAAQRFQLPWPILADVNGSIWKAYKSESWPNRYLIDPNGEIVLHIEGEGNNAPMEAKIRELLMPQHPQVASIPPDPAENTFAPQCGRTTEETYVGDWFGRGALQNQQKYDDGYAVHFKANQDPDDGRVILDGNWRTDHDGVTAADKRDAKAILRYHARSVYAVMSVENPKNPVRVNLVHDGVPLKDAAGADVNTDGRGSYIEVSEPRMYYLLKNPSLASHLLTLTPEAKGFTLHSFTYGNDCQQNFEEK